MKCLFTLLVIALVITFALSACSSAPADTGATPSTPSVGVTPPASESAHAAPTPSIPGTADTAPSTPSFPATESEPADVSQAPPTAPPETEIRDVDTFNRQQQGGIAAGQLTAGEWNDNQSPELIQVLMHVNDDFRTFENRWRLNLSHQINVTVRDGNNPVNNARIELLDGNMNRIHSAVTNNQGVAFLFNNLRIGSQTQPQFIRATNASGQDVQVFDPGVSNYVFTLAQIQEQKSLDLMFVVDTTGSMGDELRYLQAELTDIVRQVERQHANLDLRLSVVVYRDFGDEYLVRSVPFSHNTGNQVEFLNAQRAAGGGDWEEAVHIGLSEALENHDWREDSTARLLFLVLDAPPHHTGDIPDEIHRLMLLSSDMGVRIIPVASSGIDTISEFLFRSFAKITGGTYVFLTSHSGIGAEHLEPTVGSYNVRLLNELLVEIINRYLA